MQALDLGARDNGDRFCIFSMRFSQDGDEILCGAKDGYIYLYDRSANRRSLKVGIEKVLSGYTPGNFTSENTAYFWASKFRLCNLL